jgi:hypothetical protein
MNGENFFSDSALDAIKNPNYDPTKRHPGHNPEFSKLIHMHPADFLSVARNGHDPEKEQRVENVLKSGEKFSDLPELHFKHNGEGVARVSGHEGRHRARALLARGVDSMPVIFKQTYNGDVDPIRFTRKYDSGYEYPHTLKGEIGPDEETSQHKNNQIEFPVKENKMKTFKEFRQKLSESMDVNKGAFHRWLGIPEDQELTDADIQKDLNSNDKAVNKMANFALNARKWKH